MSIGQTNSFSKARVGASTQPYNECWIAVEATEKRLKELRKIGRNVTGMAIANMGDMIESCDGHYSSQLFTVQGTMRQQLLTALDLSATGMQALFPLVDHGDALWALCNHGEWMRRGGKPVTSDSDNSTGFLADALQRILAGRPDMEHVKWHIPHDEYVTAVELSGVFVAHTHGHKISGKEIDWLRGQSIRLLREQGREPRLWVTAHRHHANVVDMGPWFRIQCSSLDGGSKWFTDMSGNWSTAGTTTFLVGNHDVKGFSDWAVL
jgi:hypothetical protein